MLVPGSTDSAFWSFLRFFCWGMMLHSALDCFHLVDPGTEARHLYPKAKPSRSGYAAWERLFFSDENYSALAILERQYCISYKNWDVNSWHNSGLFFCSPEIPPPWVYSWCINLYFLPPKKTQAQLLLPCQHCLSVLELQWGRKVLQCWVWIILASPGL